MTTRERTLWDRARERLLRWLRGPKPPMADPYRTAAPELAAREAWLRGELGVAWRTGRESASASVRSARATLGRLWTHELLMYFPRCAGVGALCATLTYGMLQLAPWFAPRVSTPMTHLLAVPCGCAVGLCAAIAFLSFGALALLASALLVGTALTVAWCAVRVAFAIAASARIALRQRSVASSAPERLRRAGVQEGNTQ